MVYMLTWRGYIDGYHITIYGIHTDDIRIRHGVWQSPLHKNWGISSWESLLCLFNFMKVFWENPWTEHAYPRILQQAGRVLNQQNPLQRFSMDDPDDERWCKPLIISLSQLNPIDHYFIKCLKTVTKQSQNWFLCWQVGIFKFAAMERWHDVAIGQATHNGTIVSFFICDSWLEEWKSCKRSCGAVAPGGCEAEPLIYWFTESDENFTKAGRQTRIELDSIMIDHSDQKWTKHEQEFLMLSAPIDAQLFAFGGSNSYLPTIMESLFKGGGQNFSKSLAGWHGSVAFNSLSQHIL